MKIKEFDKMFGLAESIEEEKIRFVNRIENGLFSDFMRSYDFEQYKFKFLDICYQLGEDGNELIKQNSFMGTQVPSLKTLSNKDFVKTLRVIVAMYTAASRNPENAIAFSKYINDALNRSNISLGISWSEGIFYPAGDKFLDKTLIDESMILLEKYPNEKKDMMEALDNYYSKSLYGVIEHCYIAVEGISRQLLGNKRTLDNNLEDLLKLLQFSKFWDKIFLNYLKFAHEYRRHAGENRHDLKPEEVEGYLYMTCLMIRAAIKASNK